MRMRWRPWERTSSPTSSSRSPSPRRWPPSPASFFPSTSPISTPASSTPPSPSSDMPPSSSAAPPASPQYRSDRRAALRHHRAHPDPRQHAPPPGASGPQGRDAAPGMSPSEDTLAIEGPEKSYGGLHAVAGASFTVGRGSITALIGPNGAGKTTLFDLITGFTRPDGGRVRFEGKAIAGLPPHRVARLGLVRTFQLTRVFAAMTVMENMMLAPPDQPGESLLGLILAQGRHRRSEAAGRERALTLL